MNGMRGPLGAGVVLCAALGLACGGLSPATPPDEAAPAPVPAPAPGASPSEPVDPTAFEWPRPLVCPEGSTVVEGDPHVLHPEYWPVMPVCRMSQMLDFRKPFRERANAYPFDPMPEGSRHRWCASDQAGRAAPYEMMVPDFVTDGDTESKWILGSVREGRAHGRFEVRSFPDEGPLEASGELIGGLATGRWTFEVTDPSSQGLCPPARGDFDEGVPVGEWTAEIVDNAEVTRFVGTWSPAGWQGEVTVGHLGRPDAPGSVTRIRDSLRAPEAD